jgi:hypothetical protein
MIRTQISLTEDQMRRLRAEATRRGVPIAVVVREAVDRAIPDAQASERAGRWQRALSAIGRFRSDGGDVSARHDELAGEVDW